MGPMLKIVAGDLAFAAGHSRITISWPDLEFRRALFDGFVRHLDLAYPNGFAGNVPADRLRRLRFQVSAAR